MPSLPSARGPVSGAILDALERAPGPIDAPAPAEPRDPSTDEDLQLALAVCYELHYRGLPGVDERWEWEPGLLALRRDLEDRFEHALRAAVPLGAPGNPRRIDDSLRALVRADDGPSLSLHLLRQGTLEQFREFAVHRSIYQLKEADPHSWAIPRLTGRPKAALVEIQSDEYGGGRPERIHAELFARALAALGLDPAYGAYLDRVPALTLATVNLMSLLGLHRRLRGALVGHLAAFEMTSSVPNRRYGDALRRMGMTDPEALDFFDEHVTADAVHESVAAVDLAGGLAAAEPELVADILFGARALLELERRWSAMLLDAWARGRSSLRAPLAAETPAVAA